MNILVGILIAITGILAVVIIRLSTTFFHEMGHAIPALLFTNKSVQVYIGSYGDIENTKVIELGRLKLFLKWNIFDWMLGMCRHEDTPKSTIQHILIILGGPIASLLVSLPLIFNLHSIQDNKVLFFGSLVFIVASLYDLIINLYPFRSPIIMHDGAISFNDGRQLMMVLSRTQLPSSYAEFEKLYHEKDYEQVIVKGQNLIEQETSDRFIYDFVSGAQVETKDYQGALDTYLALKRNIGLAEEDYFEIGKVYKSMNSYSEAMKYFQHYRYKHYQDVNLLYEIADLHFQMGEYDKSFEDLGVLLSINNLHYKGQLLHSQLLTMNRDYDQALHILGLLLEADPKEAMVYYQYGLVYERMNDDLKAHENYLKAESLGCDHYGLAFKIEQTRPVT